MSGDWTGIPTRALLVQRPRARSPSKTPYKAPSRAFPHYSTSRAGRIRLRLSCAQERFQRSLRIEKDEERDPGEDGRSEACPRRKGYLDGGKDALVG